MERAPSACTAGTGHRVHVRLVGSALAGPPRLKSGSFVAERTSSWADMRTTACSSVVSRGLPRVWTPRPWVHSTSRRWRLRCR